MIATIASPSNAELEDRDLRAATEDIDLEKESEGMYWANGEYVLDIIQGACWCPDNEFRNAHCKHLRKAEMIENERPIPNVLGLDEDLRKKITGLLESDEGDEAPEATEGSEEIPITDGGVVATGPLTPSEELPGTDTEIDVRAIVAEQTSTVEDLPDFSYDQPTGWHGEPYSSIVTFACETVERLIEAETNAEPATQ